MVASCPSSPRENEIPTLRAGEDPNLCDRTTYSQPANDDLDPLKLLKQSKDSIFRIDANKNRPLPQELIMFDLRSMFNFNSGTGFVIGKQGNDCLVITNNHVISDSQSIKLVTNDRGALPVRVELADSSKDIAVLRTRMNCTELPLARSINDPNQAAIFSFPMGSKEIFLSMSDGKLKVVSRAALQNQPHPIPSTEKFLVVNANVLPGGSGSPVIVRNGEVVGMTFAAKDRTQALAIPFTELARLKDSLIQTRRLDPP